MSENRPIHKPGRLCRETFPAANRPFGCDHALRELVATAFEIVVHVGRSTDGSVRVFSIEEISGVSDASFETDAVFMRKDGNFAATGKVPRFYSELEARGIPADQAVFR